MTCGLASISGSRGSWTATAALRAQAATSPFLAALDLASRIRLLPGRLPVGAIGAALIGNVG